MRIPSPVLRATLPATLHPLQPPQSTAGTSVTFHPQQTHSNSLDRHTGSVSSFSQARHINQAGFHTGIPEQQQQQPSVRQQPIMHTYEEPDAGHASCKGRIAALEQQRRDLQKQLDEATLANQDLQRRLEEVQRQASETECDLRGQLQTIQSNFRRPRSQSTPREIEFWNVPRSDVKIECEIGRGGWGSVSKGTFHGQAVAIKQLYSEIMSEDHVSRLHREVRVMAQVRHPNLLLFIAAVFDERVDPLHPPLIITELLDVDLRKAYRANMVMSNNLLSIFQDVACALNYLHCLREPIIHRDLSAPNVLLEAMANHRWKAKVSDFGSANIAKLAQTAAEGAIMYSAPECLPEELRGPNAPNLPQTPKIDVYSYGVLLCEVVTCTLPEKLGQLKMEMKQQSSSLHSLAEACTKYYPAERPTITYVIDELSKLSHKELEVSFS